MAPNYERTFTEEHGNGDYTGGPGAQYRTPDGAPRHLSAAERATLIRRAGMRPDAAPDRTEPEEYGIRVG